MDPLVSEKFDLFREEVSKFVVFTDEEWQVVTRYCKCGQVKKKQHLTEKSKVCDYIGFITSGSVRYYHIKDGEEITGYFSFEREFTSSYSSFLTRRPGLNYIQALEPTQLITISYTDMQQMYADELIGHKMERLCRLLAEYTIICYDERVTSFLTQSPEERYQKLLENGKSILQRIPQHYVANFLGITAVSLSRIRRRMLKSA
jgi:CRP-like cAMP-binding protein